ncbi:MAG TPA: class I SAM-dependent methyltransferase [Candidatus Sulfopaludibacter sp.]|nr:class I SAM-dependent methyltransferase [Candidatus Sulfopaludibacter sp.]
MIRERTHCRTCGSKNLRLILDLGKTALANDFLNPEEVAHYKICLPLRVVLCLDCSLVQLADTVDPKILYSRYAYITSTSRTMEAHLSDQSAHLLSVGRSGARPKVLEIASNTGVFLKKFQERGCEVLGVEPAQNICEVAEKAGIPTRGEFFNAANAKKIKAEWGEADLILGRHVFAHIDDLHDLIAGLETVSHRETLIAFEVPYLVDFFERTEYDTIYHEHLSYLSVRALAALVEDSPFALSRIDHYQIHGGSILFHLRHRSSKAVAHESVGKALEVERRMKLTEAATWKTFTERVDYIRSELPALVRKLKSQDKRIIGYGASAKGNTLLNTCGLGIREMDYIIDNTPFKQNKVAPGSWLPIRPPESLLKEQPDFALLLAWNFAPEIIGREAEYQKRGGRFIVPIPKPEIVGFPL